MYFDELYYPSTAAEFLRDWRYGISSNIFEWTHPHVAKYIQAVSLVALGNDRVIGTANVGASVRDSAFEPAFALPGGGFGGDRIAVATGADVRVAPHGSLDSATVVPLAGASAVAFDRETDRLFGGTDGGGIWTLAGGGVNQLGAIDGPVLHLTVVARDRLVARTAGDRLVLVDGSTGATLGAATLPGLRGIVRVPVGDHSLVVASVPTGLVELDTVALAKVGEFPLVAPPAGFDFVDGSDYGWRNQDTLPEPRLYVALEGNQLVALRVETDGKLTVVDTFPMPGPVTDVRWDRPTNMVYALGRTPAGQPTLYVVEPHTDSVFADAALPFEPTTWLLDAQPNTPSLDRQRGLAFSADGTVAIVDTGSHAVAWRLPGVVSGALTMGLLYLLTRMLFRRRLVADLLAVCLALDGLLFSQGRLGTNDSIMGFFIIAAITLLAYLLMGRDGPRRRDGPRGWSARGGREGRHKIGTALGLLGVGILLGLALATKWVGAYAIGGCVLLVLAQTPVGRRLALVGLLLVTSVLGYQAIAGSPPNVLFLLLMIGVTVAAGVAILRPRSSPGDRGADGDSSGSGAEDAEDEDRDVAYEADGAPVDPPVPEFADPGRRFGIPFGLAMACLTLVPSLVYVLTYVPWALSASGSPQLFPGWPPGHTGQTFVELQGQMYAYHADLRTPHGNGSPWWAWPFGLRPFWGYFDTYSDGSQALMFMADNPVLVWLSVPAIGFGIWQAWRRRSPGLAFVLIAFLSLWLPWTRIDRVAYNYHYYTPIMFAYVLLAYFLAELWDGPSRRTLNLARASFALILVAPALLWIFKDPLCGFVGANQVDPNSFECNRPLSDVAVPIAAWLLLAIPLAWLVLRMREPRRLVVWVFGAAVVAFVVLYPALSALPIPNGWPLVYQGLLPTWEVSFHFISNTQPAVAVPLLGLGPIVVLAATIGLLWLAVRARERRWLSGVIAGFAGRGAFLRPPGASREAAIEWPVEVAAAEAVAPAEAAAPAPRAPERPVVGPKRGRVARALFDGTNAIDRYGVPLGLFAIAWLVYTLINHDRPARVDYFVPLTDAFLHGRLGLDAGFSWMNELVQGRGGLYYVVFPPAPAILLMPSVWLFGPGLEQARSSILLGAINVALVSVVIAQMGVERRARIVLSLVFGFGTIVWYSAQVGSAWHFAHVVATFFMLLAILACQRDARTWLIGLLFAGAVLSRLPVLLAAPFFLAYVVDRSIRERTGDRTPFGALQSGRVGEGMRRAAATWRERLDVRRLATLGIGLGVGLGVPLLYYLAYNQLRFGSPFENGYALIRGLLQEPDYRDGFFAISSIPRQVSRLLLSVPAMVPGFPWFQPLFLGGPSILLTTPLFLWAFKARRPDLFNLGAWAALVLILIPNLTHADPGGVQFGYRYGQDVYPFLFLLTVRGLRGRISLLAWVAIAVGLVVNAWGMAAAYFAWWA